jgi:VWFA-related protein
MQELAGQTGGAVFIPKSMSDLDNAFLQIASDLAQQYVLMYYPAEQQRDTGFHVIELKVKARKDVRVRTRKGYYSRKRSNVTASDR